MGDEQTKLNMTQQIYEGGSVGRNRADLVDLVRWMVPRLPSGLPRHLLGIGDLESIGDCAALGIDTFDSAYPTRLMSSPSIHHRTMPSVSPSTHALQVAWLLSIGCE